MNENTDYFAKRPKSFQTNKRRNPNSCHDPETGVQQTSASIIPKVPTTQPYVAAIVSAPCRDQPCLITATSAPFTVDATDSAHDTLTLRPNPPDGACLSIPRESGYDHFNI
jgi:hypothetical protein